jgi:hypothetical protein
MPLPGPGDVCLLCRPGVALDLSQTTQSRWALRAKGRRSIRAHPSTTPALVLTAPASASAHASWALVCSTASSRSGGSSRHGRHLPPPARWWELYARCICAPQQGIGRAVQGTGSSLQHLRRHARQIPRSCFETLQVLLKEVNRLSNRYYACGLIPQTGCCWYASFPETFTSPYGGESHADHSAPQCACYHPRACPGYGVCIA